MTILLIRTVLIYLILMIAMRMMGKRQIGELEISDLITTLLISEIASLPITDGDIPISHAIVPIIALMTFEVVTSTLVANFPKIKTLVTARPATLINNGHLCQKEMKKARISADELISELRQKEITDLSDVRYAILEQNGKISVLPRAKRKPPTAEQMKLSVEDEGLYYIMVDKGCINRHNLNLLGVSEEELKKRFISKKLSLRQIYLMMMNEKGDVKIIRKDKAST
ncbi:MAG: DUF421 domain-containing protein [Clostridia bacterium]|nr:DUF421 domain-containing protein [Clostridia bacterium]